MKDGADLKRGIRSALYIEGVDDHKAQPTH